MKIFTYVEVREDGDERDILDLVNGINAHYFPNSVFFKWSKLWSYFYVPIAVVEYGVDIVQMMVISSSNFLASIRDLDRHNLVI